MMEPSHTEIFPVRLHDCGPSAHLKLESLFNYFQDTATIHADRLGIGVQYLREQGRLWVLSRLRGTMFRWPEINETVQVLTYPTTPKGFFAVRHFTVTTAGGELLGKATSFWLLLDMRTLRPLKILQHLEGLLPANEDMPCHFSYEEMGKLPEDPTPETKLSFEAQYSNIDLNRHLNNAYYAGLVTDMLGELTGQFVLPSEFQINFNHACPLHGKVLCSGTLENGAFHVSGSDGAGHNHFQACGRLDNRVSMTADAQ